LYTQSIAFYFLYISPVARRQAMQAMLLVRHEALLKTLVNTEAD
jgi:hypothetical protein